MKIGVSITVSVISALLLSPAAPALDFGDLLKNYLGTAANNQTAAGQDTIKINMNTRQAQLEQEIAAGVASGQLTPQEENDLRADLNRIAALQGSYLADGVFSNFEVQSLLNEMSNFSGRLSSYMSNTTSVATGSYRDNNWFRNYFNQNSSNDVVGNQQMMRANIDSRQAQLDSLITEGMSNGRLNWNDAQSFRNELGRIANNEYTSLADGRLSYSESRRLMDDLEALNTKVTSHLHGQWGGGGRRGPGRHHTNINTQQTLLRQRIERGRISGRISAREYDQLIRDDQKIESLESQLRNSGRRLTFEEQRRLHSELDQLSRRISQALDSRQAY
ncbi:MAG: hypothetical protein K2W82_07740 [Candidatus Obscuribacterales bacterium]|nr:hypothetical protein [Candidatus Obscuribacterales bacterium]